MAENVDINVTGNGNVTSGRDTVFKLKIPKALRFCEDDLKGIVVSFAESSKHFSNLLNDFTRPKIEDKNALNKLGNDYFEYIKEYSLPYFHKIERFLKDPRNAPILKNYLNAVVELQHIILANRNDFDGFEEIFGALYDHMLSIGDNTIRSNKTLVIVFLHFMYWNCDIGKKK